MHSLFAIAAVLLALGMVSIEIRTAPEEPGARVKGADNPDTR
jgi:hypothetical protein